MKEITREMIRIYKPKGIDWMGYNINYEQAQLRR